MSTYYRIQFNSIGNSKVSLSYLKLLRFFKQFSNYAWPITANQFKLEIREAPFTFQLFMRKLSFCDQLNEKLECQCLTLNEKLGCLFQPMCSMRNWDERVQPWGNWDVCVHSSMRNWDFCV